MGLVAMTCIVWRDESKIGRTEVPRCDKELMGRRVGCKLTRWSSSAGYIYGERADGKNRFELLEWLMNFNQLGRDAHLKGVRRSPTTDEQTDLLSHSSESRRGTGADRRNRDTRSEVLVEIAMSELLSCILAQL